MHPAGHPSPLRRSTLNAASVFLPCSRQDLVYGANSSGHAVSDKASVAAVFKLNDADATELRFTRSITGKGGTEYRIDKKVCTVFRSWLPTGGSSPRAAQAVTCRSLRPHESNWPDTDTHTPAHADI